VSPGTSGTQTSGHAKLGYARASTLRQSLDTQLDSPPGSTASRPSSTALRYFALDGTDHPSHKAQGSMIRRYVIWRNDHAADQRLRQVVARANVACDLDRMMT
jgi:hypothetical protein